MKLMTSIKPSRSGKGRWSAGRPLRPYFSDCPHVCLVCAGAHLTAECPVWRRVQGPSPVDEASRSE